MTALVIGLVLFLGLHSTRIVADGARSRFIAQRGERTWRGLYSLGSGIGFVLIIWGFGLARREPVVLWSPPDWTRPLASLLTLAGIVLITAAYVPRNHFKAWVGHPMVLGVKVWAFAHLLATRTLADLLLFGGFLVWAILCYRSLRARDRTAGRQPVAGQAAPTVIAIVVGAALWFAFAYWLHGPLIGVRPFG
ncbi:MAG TPA: NnrU family protein [Burkholderiaceae bacterium]|nr:NnrU family protein [Burkholderiaceae bacterium]